MSISFFYFKQKYASLTLATKIFKNQGLLLMAHDVVTLHLMCLVYTSYSQVNLELHV